VKEKNYNKYTSFTDRFPFIIFAVILVFAIIFIFQFKAKYPLPFFSSYTLSAMSTNSAGQAMNSINLTWGCGQQE